MNPSKPNNTRIDIEPSNRRVSFAENNPDEELSSHQHQSLNNTVPLLLQPSYARSKSMIFDELRNFRISLKWCALDHSSCVGKLISYVTFIFFTILVPLLTSIFVEIPSSAPEDDPFSFNKLVQLPESALAIISFFTISSFFRRYGLRQLLFLDALQEDTNYVRRGYTRELEKAFRYLTYIILPSFLVELVHKIIFFSAVKISGPDIRPGFPLNSIVFVLMLVCWVYRTGVFLLVCVLFRLTCELQKLRFEGVHKLFEGCGSEAGVIFKEHVRIRRQLWVTSHRYRFFIIGCVVTITVSQLGALLLVLASNSHKTFFNSGDLVICSAVQLSGFFMCILGAARITHRAQGIVAIATRWHMLVTTASAESEHCKSQVSEGLASDTDSDDSSNIHVSVIPPQLSSFQTRQTLITYLQHNHGGITVYGYSLDRGLLHTLFAFEFSLVLWILSKVVVLSK
ncbi:hypothetical protein LR48_Vigan252s006400 [Vigna angularis]|uniref:Uncharacterized protein n=2 Tax=Phaseolus angularis TaxID=3914 RepID=A0A0L9T6Z2_PHAAN|nr:uncharacterized protein LOC108319730 [Vigna angularis]KOM26352.1 hypothetical protein LR48_Vigan252s006400 [Vigna angularis]BAT74219.1 hypothetical protein VIGAN_01184000 [Vigna angularis var. angularis]